jgi:putative DNA primase/helicase
MTATSGGSTIDFAATNQAALGVAESLLRDVLPDGICEGEEWTARNPTRNDKSRGSFKVNVVTGAWCDFATDDTGGDLISLFAYLRGSTQGEAARYLTERLGLVPLSLNAGTPKPTRASKWNPSAVPPADAPPPPLTRLWKKMSPTAIYTYRNRSGQPTSYMRRFDRGGGKKEVIPLTYGQMDGRAGWFNKAPAEPRPLYGLEQFSTQPKDARVIIVEGEKTTDAARKIFPKAIVVTSPFGSKSPAKADWSPLRDRSVWVFPDNDEAGTKYARTVAQLALEAGARGVKVLDLKGAFPDHDLPKGWDVADAGESGITLKSLGGLLDRTDCWDDASAVPLASGDADTNGVEGCRVLQDEPACWDKPESLTQRLPPVSPFDSGLLPPRLISFVDDIRERFQVPRDFVAVVLIVVLSAVIGRRIFVMPKRYDDWTVTPNLWGGLVAPPGFMKTPVIDEGTKPLRKLQKEAFEEYEEEMRQYEREMEAYELRRKVHQSEAVKIAKQGGSVQPFDVEEPEKPRCLRYLVNDSTVEKLHEILGENPQGILYLRDELVGFFAVISKRGREGERPFFLEAWNGDGSFTFDRIGRGTVHVPHVCVALLGGVQPAKLHSYMADALYGGADDDGLAQRLQLLVYPDLTDTWEDIDREPDRKAVNSIEQIFRALARISPEQPLVTRFDDEAQKLFSEWRHELEVRLRGEDMHPALVSHLAKYRSLMPSLALILHAADQAVPGPIPERIPLIQAQRAADLCAYLESHIRRVHASAEEPLRSAASELGEKLRGGVLGERFTVRDVYLKGWRGLHKTDLAHEAIAKLESANWVRKVEQPPSSKGGRPPEVFEINPEVSNGAD